MPDSSLWVVRWTSHFNPSSTKVNPLTICPLLRFVDLFVIVFTSSWYICDSFRKINETSQTSFYLSEVGSESKDASGWTRTDKLRIRSPTRHPLRDGDNKQVLIASRRADLLPAEMWRVEKLTSVDHHLTLIPWEYPGKLSETLYLHRSMLKKLQQISASVTLTRRRLRSLHSLNQPPLVLTRLNWN